MQTNYTPNIPNIMQPISNIEPITTRRLELVDANIGINILGPILNTRTTTALELRNGVYTQVAANESARYEDYGIVSEPAATQLVAAPVDVTAWVEGGTCTVSESGTIAGVTAYQLTGQLATTDRREFLTAATLTGKHVESIHGSPGNQNNLRVTIRDNTTVLLTRIDCNTSNGTTAAAGASDAGSFTASSVEVDGGYRFNIVFTPLNDGNSFGIGVGTGTATATDTIRVALANVVPGSIATSPIPTQSTRAVSTDTITIENFPHRKGYVKVLWTPDFDYDDLALSTFNKGILTPTTSAPQSVAQYNRGGGGSGTLVIKDSSLNQSIAVKNWVKNTTYTIVASWDLDQQLMGICVDGTDSGNGTFAGWTLADVVTFGMSTIAPQAVKMTEMAGRFLTPAQRIALTS